jgi:hypothetical protein
MSNPYQQFLEGKQQLQGNFGFAPIVMPDGLKDFQKHLVEWSLVKGRSAVFADCGLGKTFIQLAWAENVKRKTNKPVLILTPLAVSAQTVREAEKFGIDAVRVSDGKIPAGANIIVTNYERLHYFDAHQFAGCVCDESSILKNFDGMLKAQITEFMRRMPYRLLCTATAAPNDYIELGTSSEALGDLGYMDMLSKFFKNDQNSNHPNRNQSIDGKWRFRGHAERDFWRWVCSWARAVRKPSDIGFSDDGYDLPSLIMTEHVVKAERPSEDFLFDMAAITMEEQNKERRRTVKERCEKAAEVLQGATTPAVAWAHLNDESDLLEKIIPGAIQVSGKDKDERKEEIFDAFQRGEIPVIVTKSTIAGFGMNWQHCAWHTFFPSHSFEQFYQSIRRSLRFGQVNDVQAHIITSEGVANVLSNLKRKQAATEVMFDRLVSSMNNELHLDKKNYRTNKEELPSWL